MSIIIDLIIVAIIALCIFLGYKKGLTQYIIKIFSFIIAVIVAFILFKPVSNWVIQNTTIDEGIKEAVVNVVKNDVEDTGKVKEDSNLPKAMVDYINNSIESAVNEAKQNVIETAAETIANSAINVGVAILVFIIVRILLILVSMLSKALTNLPVIKQFDKAGGIIYGLLKSLVIIFIVFAIISFISPMIEQTGIIVAINKSFIGGLLYNNNLLLKIIFK